MSIFGALKNAWTSGSREISKEYGKDRSFLDAVCAASALVANADGTIEDTERLKAVDLITNHDQLSKLYTRPIIEQALNESFRKSKDSTGRNILGRTLDSVATDIQKAEDVYLVAVDISMADGSVSDDEKATLEKIARRLGVDPRKFEF